MGKISMRTMRRAARSTDTVPFQQFATASEILDAASTATVVTGSQRVAGTVCNQDWSFRPLRLISISSIPEPGIDGDVDAAVETSTINRNVLLEEIAQIAHSPAAGIFVAARPARKKLFEMQFRFPVGGLPKRKPFVWIPEDSSEE
jgi:hypothetical protein